MICVSHYQWWNSFQDKNISGKLAFFSIFRSALFHWNPINYFGISRVILLTFLFVFRKVPEIELVKRTALREKFADILTAEEEILQGKSTAFYYPRKWLECIRRYLKNSAGTATYLLIAHVPIDKAKDRYRYCSLKQKHCQYLITDRYRYYRKIMKAMEINEPLTTKFWHFLIETVQYHTHHCLCFVL